MTADIIKFYPANAAENPDMVLEQALGVYDDVVCIGWDKQKRLTVHFGGTLTNAETFWLLKIFEQRLLQGEYNEEGAEE